MVGGFTLTKTISFTEFTSITFKNNRVFYGGAILVNDHSNITVTGNSVLYTIYW